MTEPRDFHQSSIVNIQSSILPLFSVMNLKIRQYLSAKPLLPVAKVFAQSVDITPSGFGSQRTAIL
jgi:hypothetical protein